MRILTNGCSFSRGPTAWPNHIAKWFNADLVNLAQAGAGNTYISRATMSELQARSYDLVLIMWSGLERIDLQVEDIDLFDATIYTSKYQSQQNDWPSKIVHPVNDQDYVQKNWVFGTGFINQDKAIIDSGLFQSQYRFQDFDNHLQRSFFDMLSLENYLQNHNIPYAFAFYQNYIDQVNCYTDQLDWRNIYNDQNLYDITKRINDWDSDGFHPGPLAQKLWAQELHAHIVTTQGLVSCLS